MTQRVMVELTPDEAQRLRARGLPEGTALVERDEVVWFDHVYSRSPAGLYVPEALDPIERLMPKPEPVYGLDLFAGAGGFSLGMHWGGIDVVAANEWDATAASTYLLNLGHPDCRVEFLDEENRRKFEKATRQSEPGWIGSACRAAEGWPEDKGCRAFFVGDVRKLTGERVLEVAGVPRIDVAFGGPPCQGLSSANSKACLEDPRNGMIWEFLRMVEELEPGAFLIENVPQILTAGKGGLFSAIVTRMNAAGYDVVAQKVNASWYGVPQHRVRALIAGTREGVGRFQFPMPSTWGLGRMANGRSWTFLDTETGADCGQRALPTPVVYDEATGTFQMATSEAEPPDADETLDIFGAA